MSPSLKTIPTPPTMIWWVDRLRPLKHCAKSEIMDKKKKKKQVVVFRRICWKPLEMYSADEARSLRFFAKRCWRTCSLLFCFIMQIWSICCAYTETQTLPLVLYHAIVSLHRGFLCSLLFLEFPHHCSTSVHLVHLRESVMNCGRCSVVSIVSRRPRVGCTLWQPDQRAECAPYTGGIIPCIKWFMSSLYSVSADIWIFLRAVSQSSRRKVTAVT